MVVGPWTSRLAKSFLLSFVIVASSTAAAELFTPTSLTGTLDPSLLPASIRQRNVLVDEPQLLAQPSSLVLNFFDDVSLTAVETETTLLPSGSLRWVGEVSANSPSIVSLVLTNGDLTGVVALDGDFYELRPMCDGVHAVLELDPDVDEPGDDIVGESGAPVAGGGAPTDSIEEVDLLIAYTPKAVDRFGDLQGFRSAFEARVELANAAFADSLASPRLRIVDFYALDDPETSPISFSNITNRSDGRLDDLPVVRDTYSADLVNIVLTNAMSAGQGQLSISALDEGFSYVNSNSPLVFVHEIAHTFGAHHDRGWPFFPPEQSPNLFNFGYLFGVPELGSFRTVMGGRGGGKWLPLFSNPDVLFNGQPTGIAAPDPEAAHNARTINDGAQTVANRRLADPIKPGDIVTMLSGSSGSPPVEFLRHRDGKPPELVATFGNGEVVADFTIVSRNTLMLLTIGTESVCDPLESPPCVVTTSGKLLLLDVESGFTTPLTEGGTLTFTDAVGPIFPLVAAGDAFRLPNLRAVVRFGNEIIFFNPSFGEQTVVATIGLLRSIFVDVDGTVVATSRASACVLRVALEDGATDTLACASDPGAVLSDPGPVVVHPDGSIFVGDSGGRIVSIDPVTGAQSNFATLGIQTNSPFSMMHIDWRGNIVASDGNAGAVLLSPSTGSEFVLDTSVGSGNWGVQSARFHSPRLPDCMDGRDNDGDTLADFPDDPQCASFRDFNELLDFGGGAGGGSGCGLGAGIVPAALFVSAVRLRARRRCARR